MTQKEKASYLFENFQDKSNLSLERFPDGTAVKSFLVYWKYKSKYKNLTKEEQKISDTVLEIEKRIYENSVLNMLSELEQLILQNPTINLNTTTLLFSNGESIMNFWKKWSMYLKQNQTWNDFQIALKERMKKIKTIQEIESIRSHFDFLEEVLSQYPFTYLSHNSFVFENGVSLSGYWNTSLQKVKKYSKTELTASQEYLVNRVIHLIRLKEQYQIRSKIDRIYEKVQKCPKVSLCQDSTRFEDNTAYRSFWLLWNSKAKQLKNSQLTETEVYVLYTMAQIDEMQGKTRERKKHK